MERGVLFLPGLHSGEHERLATSPAALGDVTRCRRCGGPMRVVAAVTDAHDTSAATERIADLMARAQAVCPIDSPRFGPRCREIGEWNPSRECRG